MGYYAATESGTMTITNPAAAAAVLTTDPTFYWDGTLDLIDNLREWGFASELQADGAVLITSFDGKWRDQESVFGAIAPWVEGFMGFVGEDHELWGWGFEGGELVNKTARIEWV